MASSSQSSKKVSSQKNRQFMDAYSCDVPSTKKKKASTSNEKNSTQVVIKCNCGFPNNLFLRGEGIPGLSWERGVQMKNRKPDEWVWETNQSFKKAQVKVILNDRVYEQGQNHVIECGKTVAFEPHF